MSNGNSISSQFLVFGELLLIRGEHQLPLSTEDTENCECFCPRRTRRAAENCNFFCLRRARRRANCSDPRGDAENGRRFLDVRQILGLRGVRDEGLATKRWAMSVSYAASKRARWSRCKAVSRSEVAAPSASVSRRGFADWRWTVTGDRRPGDA